MILYLLAALAAGLALGALVWLRVLLEADRQLPAIRSIVAKRNAEE